MILEAAILTGKAGILISVRVASWRVRPGFRRILNLDQVRAQPFDRAPIGEIYYPIDYVRRRRHAALASFARGPAETVSATVWSGIEFSGYDPQGDQC